MRIFLKTHKGFLMDRQYQELVELTAVICLFNMMNRFNESLRVDLDDHPGGAKTTQALADGLSAYARRVLA